MWTDLAMIHEELTNLIIVSAAAAIPEELVLQVHFVIPVSRVRLLGGVPHVLPPVLVRARWLSAAMLLMVVVVVWPIRGRI